MLGGRLVRARSRRRGAGHRVAALVLIGTKADLRPDPAAHASALEIIRDKGLEEAWDVMWAPLFSRSTDDRVIAGAKHMMLRQSPRDIARGVTAFHTRPSRGQVLAAFQRPIVIVTGAEDMNPTLSATQAAAARHGRLHVIPDCGHYAPLERPDHLNGILRELIDTLR